MGRLGRLSQHPDDDHGHGTHTTGTMVGDDGGADTMHVEAIKMRHRDIGGRYIVYSTLRIVDQDNLPVTGATVSAEWTLPNGAPVDQ